MSVRKRAWTTGKGEKREAWVVDYVDAAGARHVKTFNGKRQADDYHASVRVDVSKGTHTAPHNSLTVERRRQRTGSPMSKVKIVSVPQRINTNSTSGYT